MSVPRGGICGTNTLVGSRSPASLRIRVWRPLGDSDTGALPRFPSHPFLLPHASTVEGSRTTVANRTLILSGGKHKKQTKRGVRGRAADRHQSQADRPPQAVSGSPAGPVGPLASKALCQTRGCWTSRTYPCPPGAQGRPRSGEDMCPAGPSSAP